MFLNREGKKEMNKYSCVIYNDLRRAFCSWKLYISVIIAFIVILHPLYEIWDSFKNYSPLQILSFPLAISNFTQFSVLFCTLPFSDSFCEDYNSGFFRSAQLRTGSSKYALGRCLSVALTGGIIISFVMLGTISLCLLLSGQPETAETAAFMNNTVWGKQNLLLSYNGSIMYLLRVFLSALFGAVWAVVGLAVSTVVTNKYITVVAPFVIYQVLWFLFSDTIFNPVALMRCDNQNIPSLGFAFFYQIFWLAMVWTISYLGIKRKIEQ